MLASYFKRALWVLKEQGPAALWQRVKIHGYRALGVSGSGVYDAGYETWRKRHEWTPAGVKAAQDEISKFKIRPLISIVLPLYKTPLDQLEAVVSSVGDQIYEDWQLCIADDASGAPELERYLDGLSERDNRISVKKLEKNLGIAGCSNAALAQAEGEYIALLDHDDLLDPGALFCNVQLLNQYPETDLIYSDEDKVSERNQFHSPFHKPDYSPELLESQNYIGHLVFLRKALMDQVGGFRSEFNGSQDFDLLLRVTEKTENIHHIPKVLYHWRESKSSTASGHGAKSYAWDAGLKALQDRFTRTGIQAQVRKGPIPGTYDVQREIQDQPTVSIVIPFKDKIALLDQCLESVYRFTHWLNFEVILVDNGSTREDTQVGINRWLSAKPNIKCLRQDRPFNFSMLCNEGVRQASGEYIVLMNNDIEITDQDWLESMLSQAQRKEIGVVGIKLLYPMQKIQHAGIVVGINNTAGHPFKGFQNNLNGYYGRLQINHNVSAVTAALCMVSKANYDRVGGLDEEQFAIALNDVDFCLKLTELGLRNVQINNRSAIHHESVSRGKDTSGVSASRYDKEKRLFAEKWKAFLESGDPYYNINLTLDREDYSLNLAKK